jgi:hypothetical protein
LRVVWGEIANRFQRPEKVDWADWQLGVVGCSLVASHLTFTPSSLGWENLCGRGSTSTATDGTTGTATTSPLAEATTATTAAVEVAAATLAATLLEATTALELLLAVTGTGVAALLDPELFLANLEGAGGDGGLVALGGLEVDESAVLLMLLVK